MLARALPVLSQVTRRPCAKFSTSSYVRTSSGGLTGPLPAYGRVGVPRVLESKSGSTASTPAGTHPFQSAESTELTFKPFGSSRFNPLHERVLACRSRRPRDWRSSRDWTRDGLDARRSRGSEGVLRRSSEAAGRRVDQGPRLRARQVGVRQPGRDGSGKCIPSCVLT